MASLISFLGGLGFAFDSYLLNSVLRFRSLYHCVLFRVFGFLSLTNVCRWRFQESRDIGPWSRLLLLFNGELIGLVVVLFEIWFAEDNDPRVALHPLHHHACT